MDTGKISFVLSPAQKSLFDSLANYYEMSKTELLRRWIYAESRDILKPAVDEAVRLDIAEHDERDPTLKNIRKQEVQQFMQYSGVGEIAASMSEVAG